jgi:carboxyl-terminal processing protease
MHGAARARAFVSDMGDLLGALHNFEMKRSIARIEFGAEALFHVDGTRRERFVGDVALTSADRDADGNDPAMAAVTQWLAKNETLDPTHRKR